MLISSKSELRKKYLEKRKSISKADIEIYSIAILEQFKNHFNLTKIKNIHIFLPIKKRNEVNTEYFITFFQKQGKRIFIPKIQEEQLLYTELLTDTILIKNSWGVLEPQNTPFIDKADLDIIITPLLYCDKEGNRIGYGKGFYDRFFGTLNKNTIKIGVNFFAPNEKISDISKEDVALDYLITPSEVFSFISKSIK